MPFTLARITLFFPDNIGIYISQDKVVSIVSDRAPQRAHFRHNARLSEALRLTTSAFSWQNALLTAKRKARDGSTQKRQLAEQNPAN